MGFKAACEILADTCDPCSFNHWECVDAVEVRGSCLEWECERVTPSTPTTTPTPATPTTTPTPATPTTMPPSEPQFPPITELMFTWGGLGLVALVLYALLCLVGGIVCCRRRRRSRANVPVPLVGEGRINQRRCLGLCSRCTVDVEVEEVVTSGQQSSSLPPAPSRSVTPPSSSRRSSTPPNLGVDGEGFELDIFPPRANLVEVNLREERVQFHRENSPPPSRRLIRPEPEREVFYDPSSRRSRPARGGGGEGEADATFPPL
jgi:hypothetical protein